jgi:hypothetical protein
MIGSYASAGTSIPGLSSGGTDIGSWEVVAHGSVILLPLCEGLVIGKVVNKNKLEIPREIIVEPIGLGTPGAYVARVASRVYTQEEVYQLQGLKERPLVKSGTSENLNREELNIVRPAEAIGSCHYRTAPTKLLCIVSLKY